MLLHLNVLARRETPQGHGKAELPLPGPIHINRWKETGAADVKFMLYAANRRERSCINSQLLSACQRLSRWPPGGRPQRMTGDDQGRRKVACREGMGKVAANVDWGSVWMPVSGGRESWPFCHFSRKHRCAQMSGCVHCKSEGGVHTTSYPAVCSHPKQLERGMVTYLGLGVSKAPT